MNNLAVQYVRYSPRPEKRDPKTAGVIEVDSIHQQIARLNGYCGLQALEVVHVIEEPEVSAFAIPMGERKGGAELLEIMRAKKITNIVAQRLDRLFRKASDCLTTVDAWNKKGIRLHLADQGGCSIDTSTSTGWLMLTILAGFAEHERNLISERTSAGMRRHQSQGRHMGGHVPYGWVKLPDGKMVEDPEEQAVIAEIRGCAESCSYRFIAEGLNSAGTPCRGGRWSHGTIKAILRRDRVA